MLLNIYIRIYPADDSVGVSSKVYSGMSKFVVTELLSEIHNMSTVTVSKLRNIFRSLKCEESEGRGVCLC